MSERRMTRQGRANAARGASVRRAPQPAARRRLPGMLKKLLVAVLLCEGAYGAMLGGQQLYQQVNSRKIEYVKIEGSLDYVREEEVKRAVSGFMSESLVSIRLDQVRAVLQAHPWIKTVSLRREWPNTMIIEVNEHVAIARWSEDRLLNQQGEIFSPPGASRQTYLPRLTGPGGSEAEVMRQYQKFNQLLYPLGLRVVALDLNERGAWRLRLDNGVSVNVGSSGTMEKMRRLVTFLDRHLMDQLSGIESIDLRYSSGISVSRRENQLLEASL